MESIEYHINPICIQNWIESELKHNREIEKSVLSLHCIYPSATVKTVVIVDNNKTKVIGHLWKEIVLFLIWIKRRDILKYVRILVVGDWKNLLKLSLHRFWFYSPLHPLWSWPRTAPCKPWWCQYIQEPRLSYEKWYYNLYSTKMLSK